MATGTHRQATSKPAAPALYRFDVEQFERMIDAGVFREGDHVELLGGLLVGTMTKNEPHNFAVDQAGDKLRATVPAGYFVREEKSLTLGRSWRPEPDIAVFRGVREDLRNRAYGASDVVLLVEVADTTYAQDRGPKWRRYAAARIPVYWIINLATRQVEVHSAPAGKGSSAHYATCATFAATDEVPVVVDGVEVGRIAAAAFFL
jgi:Uma2 family endonuclease